MVNIGIPRAGNYHYEGDLWKKYFESLGCKVIVSPETTKQIVDIGVKNSDTNLCFAAKIHIGHIIELKDKVDYVFIPSMIGEKDLFCCPYLRGMPSLIKNMFPDLNILTVDLETNSEKEISEKNKKEFFNIGKKLGKSDKEIEYALEKAWEEYKKELDKESKKEICKLKKKGCKIAIIGAEYVTKDLFCVGSVLEFLKKEGANPIFFNSAKFQKNCNPGFQVRWELEQEIINKFMKANLSKDIDGIIYISTFNCGPCFLFQEQVINKNVKKRVLILNVDETQNETLIRTRIEAFMDVVRTRK